jgi:uncharacterized BrkB/YihY/UPF0761 family membrane protein
LTRASKPRLLALVTTGPEELVASSRSRPATMRRPRGQLAPPLPEGAPLWRRVLRGTYRLGHGLVLHDALIAAPAMAFHFFLSLLPLLAFVGYVVGLIARRRGVDAVLSPILDNLPSTAEAMVRSQVDRLAGAGGMAFGPVAAVTFLWIASGGTHGLMNAVENVVGAPQRAWWRKRVLALAWVVASIASFALAAAALVRWDAVMHPIGARVTAPSSSSGALPGGVSSGSALPSGSSRPPRVHGGPPELRAHEPHAQVGDPAPPDPARRRRSRILRSGGERVLALTLSIAFATLVLATFYRLSVQHSKRVARRVLPGAVLAVVLWLVISWAFGLYVSTLADYAAFYGSLAAVAVLLVWLWLTSFAILVGAELNSQLEGLRD